MTRKRYLAVGGMLAILAGFVVVLMLRVDRPSVGVTESNLDRLVEKETRRDEVEVIFGCQHYPEVRPRPDSSVHLLWVGKEASALVYFDHDGIDGKVVFKSWRESAPTTFTGKVWRWLRELF